ncbi:MAG: hypothetical protein QM715_10230 [Nibricoccus sp.]
MPQMPADESAAGYATYEFRRVLAKIDQAQDEQALFWIASSAFGPNSFCSRFGEALSALHARHYLALQKQIILALLEDHLSGRTEWPRGGPRSLGFSGPELWEVGYHLRFARINLICDQGSLKKAAEFRDALLSELSALFETSPKVFAEVRARLDSQARAHWLRYLEKVKLPKGQADAGWSFGSLLAQVLEVFAAMLKREEFSDDLVKNAPILTRFAVAPGL